MIKTLPLLLLIFIFSMPAIAQAKEINIQTGDVRVSKDKNGNIYVNTGSRLQVPANRSYVDINSLRSYRRINGCSSRNLTRQEITQIRRTGNTVIQTHLSTNQC